MVLYSKCIAEAPLVIDVWGGVFLLLEKYQAKFPHLLCQNALVQIVICTSAKNSVDSSLWCSWIMKIMILLLACYNEVFKMRYSYSFL